MDEEEDLENELGVSGISWGEIGHENDIEGDSREDTSSSDEPRYIHFLGHEHGPQAYRRWEQDIEDWFLANNIPGEKKTTYAEETLAREAYTLWEMEVSIRFDRHWPAATWDEMKELLSEEFMRDIEKDLKSEMPWYRATLNVYTRPSLWILAPKPRVMSPCERKLSAPSVDELQYTRDVLDLLATSEDQDLFHSKLKPKEDVTSAISQVSSEEHKGNYLGRIQTDGVITTQLRGVVSRDYERFNESFQLKEEPPDQRVVASSHTKTAQQQECHQSLTEEAYRLRLLTELKSKAFSLTTTWRMFLSHLGNHRRKNQPNISSQEKDMDFSRRKNTGLTYLDTLALKKRFRPDLKEINCELKFYGFLTQNGIMENWIHVRRSSEMKVTNSARQGSLNEPYREFSNVGTPQTYVWRPGAYKRLEEINRDSIMPLKNSKAKWAHLYSLTSHWCLMKTLCKRKLVHRGVAAWKPSRSFQGFPFCPGWSLPTLLPSLPPWSHSTSLTSSKGFSLVRCTCHYQYEYELVSPLGEPDQSVKVIVGTMGVVTELRRIPHSYQLKEEPPDFGVPLKTAEGLQGNSHPLSAYYAPNLVYFGAGTMKVWRSKPFQGGGNDVVIAPDRTFDMGRGETLLGPVMSLLSKEAREDAWSMSKKPREPPSKTKPGSGTYSRDIGPDSSRDFRRESPRALSLGNKLCVSSLAISEGT